MIYLPTTWLLPSKKGGKSKDKGHPIYILITPQMGSARYPDGPGMKEKGVSKNRHWNLEYNREIGHLSSFVGR